MTPDEVKQYIDVIVKAVQPLGDKAVAAVKTYNVLAVRQVYIDGIEAVLVGLLLSFGIWKAWRKWSSLPAVTFPKVEKERHMSDYDVEFQVRQEYKWETARRSQLFGLLVTVTIIGALASTLFLFNGADLLANPQYWAIKRLVGK